MIEVTIYNMEGVAVVKFDDVNEVDYVSLVNKETYGPPALVAPTRGERPVARVEDEVLYINTSIVPFFKLVRTSD